MSFITRLADLPIGILPGSVPDDPAVPQAPAGRPARPAAPLTGRELALRAMQQLEELVHGIKRLVDLQESSTKRYLMSGSIPGGGTVGTAAEPLLAANANRRGISIQNLGTTGNLTLGLGLTTPQAGTGITLQPGQSWDGRVSGQMWRGSVSIIGSTAGVVYSVLEV